MAGGLSLLFSTDASAHPPQSPQKHSQLRAGDANMILGAPKIPVDDKKSPDIEELQEAEVWECIPNSPANAKIRLGSSPVREATNGSVILKESSPMDVPGRWNKRPSKISLDDAELGDDEMLPPHLLLKRRAAVARFPASFSMCEGAGRTLKGRDAIAFRNDVLRKTGFIEN